MITNVLLNDHKSSQLSNSSAAVEIKIDNVEQMTTMIINGSKGLCSGLDTSSSKISSTNSNSTPNSAGVSNGNRKCMPSLNLYRPPAARLEKVTYLSSNSNQQQLQSTSHNSSNLSVKTPEKLVLSPLISTTMDSLLSSEVTPPQRRTSRTSQSLPNSSGPTRKIRRPDQQMYVPRARRSMESSNCSLSLQTANLNTVNSNNDRFDNNVSTARMTPRITKQDGDEQLEQSPKLNNDESVKLVYDCNKNTMCLPKSDCDRTSVTKNVDDYLSFSSNLPSGVHSCDVHNSDKIISNRDSSCICSVKRTFSDNKLTSSVSISEDCIITSPAVVHVSTEVCNCIHHNSGSGNRSVSTNFDRLTHDSPTNSARDTSTVILLYDKSFDSSICSTSSIQDENAKNVSDSSFKSITSYENTFLNKSHDCASDDLSMEVRVLSDDQAEEISKDDSVKLCDNLNDSLLSTNDENLDKDVVRHLLKSKYDDTYVSENSLVSQNQNRADLADETNDLQDENKLVKSNSPTKRKETCDNSIEHMDLDTYTSSDTDDNHSIINHKAKQMHLSDTLEDGKNSSDAKDCSNTNVNNKIDIISETWDPNLIVDINQQVSNCDTNSASLNTEINSVSKCCDNNEQYSLVSSSKTENTNSCVISTAVVGDCKTEGDNDNLHILKRNERSKVNKNLLLASRECDSWESLCVGNDDDTGTDEICCLDPSVQEELIKSVGNVKITNAFSDYRSFQTEDERSSDGECIIEIYGFPAEFKTRDLLNIFAAFRNRAGFQLKWVDDTHALGVFNSPLVADEVLQTELPFVKTRPIRLALPESRLKARTIPISMPPLSRPKTCPALARRLVTGALGLRIPTDKKKREEERLILKEARDQRRLAAKQRDAAWDGTLTSNIS